MKKKLVFIMLTLNIILLYCNNSFSEDIIYFYDPSNVYVKLYDSVSHVRSGEYNGSFLLNGFSLNRNAVSFENDYAKIQFMGDYYYINPLCVTDVLPDLAFRGLMRSSNEDTYIYGFNNRLIMEEKIGKSTRVAFWGFLSGYQSYYIVLYNNSIGFVGAEYIDPWDYEDYPLPGMISFDDALQIALQSITEYGIHNLERYHKGVNLAIWAYDMDTAMYLISIYPDEQNPAKNVYSIYISPIDGTVIRISYSKEILGAIPKLRNFRGRFHV